MTRVTLGRLMRSAGYASRAVTALPTPSCSIGTATVYRRSLFSSVRLTTPHPSFPPIPFQMVRLVDPQTNSLRPAQSLQSILAEIDTTTHYPYLVSDSPPIVRIKAIAEVAAAAREKSQVEAQRKKRAASEKEVQVPWSSADGDLQRKLELSRKALAHGDRVTVVFAPRAGGRSKKIEPARMQEIVRVFDDSLGDIAAKWRPDEVTHKVRTLFYDPKDNVRKEAEKRHDEHAREQKKANEEKREARRKKDEERRRKSEEKMREAAAQAGQGSQGPFSF